MTDPEPPEADRADRAHIREVCILAGSSLRFDDQQVTVYAELGRFPAWVFLPDAELTDVAERGLATVGYAVTRTPGGTDGSTELQVDGWDSGRLAARARAMHSVIAQLILEPGVAAAQVLDPMSRWPAARLDDHAAQMEQLREATGDFDGWLTSAAGPRAEFRPGIPPTSSPQARWLRSTRVAQELITDLALRQHSVASYALTAYPQLRPGRSHDDARDAAIRYAAAVVDGRRPASLVVPVEFTYREPDEAVPAADEAVPITGEAVPPRSAARPEALEDAPVFPAPGSDGQAQTGPPVSKLASSRGRTFPSPRASHHP
jgi:hypothetical protein